MEHHEYGTREFASHVCRIETEATGKWNTALGFNTSKFIELGSRAPVIKTGLVRSEHTSIFQRSYSASDQHSVAAVVTSDVDGFRL
jgi:hypothetical protein